MFDKDANKHLFDWRLLFEKDRNKLQFPQRPDTCVRLHNTMIQKESHLHKEDNT